MVANRSRFGRKNGKGFYDYPSGGKKVLWSRDCRRRARPETPESSAIDEFKERLLLIQALETARCFEEGVLTDVREADVGAILGFRFSPFHRGPAVLY